MSRGPGRVQQVILSLIDNDADGAWKTSEICEHVYDGVNRVEKKHRVAVTRALRNMALPEPWRVSMLYKVGAEYCLYNPCSLESRSRRYWFEGFDHMSFVRFKNDFPEQIGRLRESVEKEQRYYAADEIGRLDMDIADMQERSKYLAMIGDASFTKAHMAELATLKEKRRLAVEAKGAAETV